jgi:hypothetical protein
MKELKTTNRLKKPEVHENRKNGQVQEPLIKNNFTRRTQNCTNIPLATVRTNLALYLDRFFSTNNLILQTSLDITYLLTVHEKFYLKYSHMLMIHRSYLRICR